VVFPGDIDKCVNASGSTPVHGFEVGGTLGPPAVVFTRYPVLINVLMLPVQLKVMYYKLVVLSRQPVHHQWSCSGGIDKCNNASGPTEGHVL